MVDLRRGLLDDTILEASGQITASNGQVIENKVFTDLKGDAGTVGYHILVPSGVHTVTIRNCRFIGGSVDSSSYFYLGSAIRIRDGCYNILIENCDFVDVPRMVHAIQCTGGIVVQCNTLDTNYGSQAVQFASGTGTGYKVAYNDIISGMQRWSTDTNFQATQNDFINCFAQDGVDIIGNRIEGRDNLDPSPVASNAAGVGGDYSIVGAAIIVGDSEGDDNTIRHNWTINAGTTAVMVSGGDGNTVQNNTVFSYGPDNPWVYVGVAYGWQSWGGSNCPTNGTADSTNVANFTNSFGQNAEPAQYFGIYGGCTETGIFGGTATRYTKNGSLTESGARDGWASAVDGLMETYGRFYPAGTSPAPLPDEGGGPGPEYVPGQDVVTRRVVRVRGRGVRLRPWSDSWKV